MEGMAMINIDYFEKRRKRVASGNILYSAVQGVRISELMYHIMKYIVRDNNYRIVVDPTCGLENYQFRDIVQILRHWNIEYRACDLNPDNWACKNGFKNCVCDVFNADTLPEGEVWVYDPPYLLGYSKDDKRSSDYSIDRPNTIDVLKRYYSEQVIRNFESRRAKLIIVKGSDFYHPRFSNNFYSFIRDILTVPEGWKINGIIVYRYFNSKTNLYGYRVRKALENRNIAIERVVVVHTYYVLLKKYD